MNFNFKRLQIHLLGFTMLCFCLVSSYVWGIRPSVQASQQLEHALGQAAHMQTLLPTLEIEIEQLNAKIEAQRLRLLDSYPIPRRSEESLIGSVSSLLTQHQLALTSLREDSNEASRGTTMILQANGDYVRLLHFINDLSGLARPTRIAALSLHPTDDLGTQCSADITVYFARIDELPDPHVLSEQSVASAPLSREGSDDT